MGSDQYRSRINLYPHSISIHAPRVGSDKDLLCSIEQNVEFQSTLPVWGATENCLALVDTVDDFNPRSPCGERQNTSKWSLFQNPFQSTLPVWGATQASGTLGQELLIFQSTLPVWGATSLMLHSRIDFSFQSTLPVWGATAGLDHDPREYGISIHAPRVGSDP